MPDFYWVFAYGSNMDIDRFRQRLTEKGFDPAVISEPCRATLPNYRLIWNYYSSVTWKAGAANIEYVEGIALPGVAFKATNLDGVNSQEGYPGAYGRETLEIELIDGSKVQSEVYIVVKPEKLKPPPVWPKQEYFDIMLRGARSFDLPSEHIKQLEQWKAQALQAAVG